MPNNAYPFGYRIVGSCNNDRRLIDWASAFTAYSDCDDRAEVNKESYLSAFCFGEDFKQLLTTSGSTKGFEGKTCSPYLWFDIDASELSVAVDDARKLASVLVERYELAEDELFIFFSGSKGFHLGLPTSLWNAEPSVNFNSYCRRLAESIAERAGVTIDTNVYDKVRAFRAPNSRHRKTGHYKRFLTLDELLRLEPAEITELATNPEPFEAPSLPGLSQQAKIDWEDATLAVQMQEASAKAVHRSSVDPHTLNRTTLQFIKNGAAVGKRHVSLFSAAANLGEFNCSSKLAWALLSGSALDSGLPPKDVRRTKIKCGLAHKGTQ